MYTVLFSLQVSLKTRPKALDSFPLSAVTNYKLSDTRAALMVLETRGGGWGGQVSLAEVQVLVGLGSWGRVHFLCFSGFQGLCLVHDPA